MTDGTYAQCKSSVYSIATSTHGSEYMRAEPSNIPGVGLPTISLPINQLNTMSCTFTSQLAPGCIDGFVLESRVLPSSSTIVTLTLATAPELFTKTRYVFALWPAPQVNRARTLSISKKLY